MAERKCWFTSDTHFGHKNIIQYCSRPFKDVKHMNEHIIQKWNEVVKPEDTVYHLGDFSLKDKVKTFMERLNGKIILIKGNHDENGDSNILQMKIQYGGYIWHLVHDPVDSVEPFVICGHVHEHWKSRMTNGRIAINVGVDVWGFQPITINAILTEMKNRVKEDEENCK